MHIYLFLIKFYLVFLFLENVAIAQNPHVTGTIQLSLTERTINGDLNYTNLPPKFSIGLNKTFADPQFSDAIGAPLIFKDSVPNGMSYEAYHYVFKDSLNAPSSFSVRYSGKQKEKERLISEKNDWKGNVAYNGYSVRASEQSAWYPILYIYETDQFIDKVTYDIEIICEDCKTMYVTGSAPIRGTKGKIKSEFPVPLLLFAGDVDFKTNEGVVFINSPLTNAQEAQITHHMNQVKDFLEKKLQIPYGSDITFVATTPTTKTHSWMFVTYPTITIIGHEQGGIKGLFLPEDENQINKRRMGGMTHEASHYYFGNFLQPNDALYWVFLEGFNEYLSLQANKEIFGEEFYQQQLKNYVNHTKDLSIIPVSEIKDSQEVDGSYRYSYTPLLLSAIEKEIGIEKIWKWMQVILSSPQPVKTDYKFFKESLQKDIITKDEFNLLEAEYINNENARQNIIETLNIEP